MNTSLWPSGVMSRQEEVLVLYGSQTGNSEQAAIEISEKIPSKLSINEVTVSSRHMQLDDFIEIERAKWPRLVVIVTSSYGVGQAPLGCYKFRELCDTISSGGKDAYGGVLDGLTYAMLGLGDSKFTTFFHNPTAIDKALTLSGAERVGTLGNADASGEGDDEQQKVISNWVDGIWTELERVIERKPVSDEKMEEMHLKTVGICESIFEDSKAPREGGGFSALLLICVPILIAVIVAALKGVLFT